MLDIFTKTKYESDYAIKLKIYGIVGKIDIQVL